MSWLLAIAIVFGFVALGGVLLERSRRRARGAAAALPEGVQAVRQARGAPARVFADRALGGVVQAHRANRTTADVVLGPDVLLVATHAGRLLEVRADRPAEVRCTGPDRLILEGQHPAGQAQVRIELLLPDAASWAVQIAERIGLDAVVPPGMPTGAPRP